MQQFIACSCTDDLLTVLRNLCIFQFSVNQNVLYTLNAENAIHRILLDCVSAYMSLNESLACDVNYEMPLIGIALTRTWSSVEEDEQRLIGILEDQTITEIQVLDRFVKKIDPFISCLIYIKLF